MLVFAIIVGLLLVIYVLPCMVFYIILFGRQKERTAAESNLLGNYYEPWREQMLAAEQALAGTGKRITVTASDGATLCGDLHSRGCRRLIIMFHGYMTAPTKNFGVSALRFLAGGYDVLLVHQRAHGPSGGRHTALGLLEQADVPVWIGWADGLDVYDSVILCGVSMGAASLAYAASGICSDKVRAMILDSSYESPWKQFRHQAKKWHIPSLIMLPLLNLTTMAFLRVNLRTTVHSSLQNARVPIVFLHGTADTTAAIEQGQANYRNTSSEKLFIPIEGAEHTLSLIAGIEQIWEPLTAFLNKAQQPNG